MTNDTSHKPGKTGFRRFLTWQNILFVLAGLGYLGFSFLQVFYPETNIGRIGKYVTGSITFIIGLYKFALAVKPKQKDVAAEDVEIKETPSEKQEDKIVEPDTPAETPPIVPYSKPPDPPANINFTSPDAFFASLPDIPPLLLQRMIKEFIYGVHVTNWSGTVEWLQILEEDVDVRVGFFSGKKSFVSASFSGSAIRPIALLRKGDNITVDGTIFQIDHTIDRVWLLLSTYGGDKRKLPKMPVGPKFRSDPTVWTPGWDFLAKLLIHFSEDPDEELQVHDLAEMIESTFPDYITSNVMQFRQMLIHWEYLELKPGKHIYVPGPRISSLY